MNENQRAVHQALQETRKAFSGFSLFLVGPILLLPVLGASPQSGELIYIYLLWIVLVVGLFWLLLKLSGASRLAEGLCWEGLLGVQRSLFLICMGLVIADGIDGWLLLSAFGGFGLWRTAHELNQGTQELEALEAAMDATALSDLFS